MMNIGVAQSGGPTAAINSSLAGVISEAKKQGEIDRIFGFRNGIEGVLRDDCILLGDIFDNEESIETLKLTPSTALGSCRVKLRSYEDDEQRYEAIFQTFERHNIGAFFYIGGNDSMDTAAKLSEFFEKTGKNIKIIGIPKTIDNDVMGTDHTPGFGSAAKYIAATVKEIIRDSQVYALTSVTVIEIMGRDAGWLTASTVVLRASGETAPHLVYLPENPVTKEQILSDIRKAHEKHKAVIIAISEGVKTPDGKYLAEDALSGAVDVFGHKYLAGVGKYLENLIKEELSCKVRSIELNVMQRCSSHLASKTDIDEAALIGAEGVKAALGGKSGEMMIFKRISDEPYKVEISSIDINSVANVEKHFPCEWLNEEKNKILDEAIKYFLPLIQGEPTLIFKDGIPVHTKL